MIIIYLNIALQARCTFLIRNCTELLQNGMDGINGMDDWNLLPSEVCHTFPDRDNVSVAHLANCLLFFPRLFYLLFRYGAGLVTKAVTDERKHIGNLFV